MHRAELINPFELNREPSLIIQRVSKRVTRSTPVCSCCNSDDIISHATAQWSNEAQEWQLANTYGQPAYCNSCDSSCGIKWLTLN
jgi:hypothetical protein